MTTVKELRALCKAKGFVGYSKMNKQQLINLLDCATKKVVKVEKEVVNKVLNDKSNTLSITIMNNIYIPSETHKYLPFLQVETDSFFIESDKAKIEYDNYIRKLKQDTESLQSTLKSLQQQCSGKMINDSCKPSTLSQELLGDIDMNNSQNTLEETQVREEDTQLELVDTQQTEKSSSICDDLKSDNHSQSIDLEEVTTSYLRAYHNEPLWNDL